MFVQPRALAGLALPVLLLLAGCQLPPAGLSRDVGGAVDAAVDRPPPPADLRADSPLARDAAISPALRAQIFAEVNAYLTAEDPGPAPALLDKLDGDYATVPYAVFAEAVRARPSPAQLSATGVHHGSWTDPLTGYRETYQAFVPPKLASTAERFPMLVFLHGAGGNGSAIAGSQSFQDAAERLGVILIAPDGHANWNWAWDEDEMSQVVLLLRVLKRRYPVDDARVVLSGFSMGGWGSFSIGAAHPDALCGLVPVAGSVGAVFATDDLAVHEAYCCPHMENLLQLRLHYIVGDQDLEWMVYQDRACARCLQKLGNDYVYEEVAGVGHAFEPQRWEAAVSWTLARPRADYPAKVVYNLAAQASSDPPGYKWPQKTLKTPQYWADIDARVDANKPARIEAQLDRAQRRVMLRATNVAKASIYLAPQMLDLSAPISIVDAASGATVWRGSVALDRRFLLTEARRRSERAALFAGRVQLDLSR